MGRRYEGVVQGGYGVGVQVMSDRVLIATMAHHFSTFRPVPGTLNVLLPLVELIADRHLRTALGLTDGARVTFELK